MIRKHRQRGIILIAVLWSIALLSGLAMAASTSFRSFVGIVTVHRDRLRADALFTAGLEVAAGIIGRLDATPVVELETRLAMPGGGVEIRLGDEGGRIDIGKAPVEVLASLFRHLGARDPEGIAQQVVAWRTVDKDQPRATLEEAQAPKSEWPFSDVRQLSKFPGCRRAVRGGGPPADDLRQRHGEPADRAGRGDRRAPGRWASAAPRLPRDPLALPDRRRPRRATLGPAQQHLAEAPQRVALVELRATLDDGFAAAAKAVIVLLRETASPIVFSPEPTGSARADRRGTPRRSDEYRRRIPAMACDSRRPRRRIARALASPARARRGARRRRLRLPRDAAAGNEVLGSAPAGAKAPDAVLEAARDGAVVLELPRDKVLRERLGVPRQAREFVPGIVRNQIERLSPWKADQAVYGFAVEESRDDGAALDVSVSITSRAVVDAARDEVAAAGLSVDRVVAPASPEAHGGAVVLWSRVEDAPGESLKRARWAIAAGVAACVAASAALTAWATASGGAMRAESEELSARIKSLSGRSRAPARRSPGRRWTRSRKPGASKRRRRRRSLRSRRCRASCRTAPI